MRLDSIAAPIDYPSLEWLELPPINLETIWAILAETIPDMQVNQILWHCLGYKFDRTTQTWDTSQVAPDWLAAYPTPPDFIASRPATVKLTRQIPAENKQLLKTQLGFKGYKIGEFGPRQTRRATAANWLLGYINSQS
jgi:Domain of unknown function (DUF1823)